MDGESEEPKGNIMVFNWKRGRNPLTATEEGEEEEKEGGPLPEAEALPIDLVDEGEPPVAAKAAAVMEAVAAAQPLLEEKRPAKPETPPAPKSDARAPRTKGGNLPPVSPVAAGTFEAMREQFLSSQRAFASRMESELRELNGAFEQSITEMSEKLRSANDAVAERDAKIAKQDKEIAKLRGALRQLLDEATALAKADEEPPA